MKPHRRPPEILLGAAEHHALHVLALGGGHASPEDADNLLDELDRAKVVEADALPPDVVRMGSQVTYRTDGGEERTASLVYPAEADISAGRVSILTPVGTALIGLRRGQSISWTGRDGRAHALTVLAVAQPQAATP
jgi:regulator of nucleoside diphosphate kinase